MLAYTFYESDNRVRRYAETLARRGDHVDAIVLRPGPEKRFQVIEGVHVHGIQTRRRDESCALHHLLKLLVFLFRSAWVLTLRHLRRPYDVIHVHSVPDFLVLAALFARLTGAKVILDIHDVVPELYAAKFKVRHDSLLFRLLVWEEMLSARFADRVIIANDIWQERVARRSRCAGKCTTILNYPDPFIFYRRKPAARGGGEFTMCYPGTLSRHQGVDLVISAMADIRDVAPNLRFLVIGSGVDHERLKAMVREHGLEDRVILKGRLPLEKVAEAMARVDLGIEPKRNESFAGEALSTKIFEFMAVGVPVIASDTRVHKFYFSQDVVAYFEAGNSRDLAAKILELLHDPIKREALAERARRFILKNSWDTKQNEYFELIDTLVKRGLEEERVFSRT
jgi:glycosyltransferase involved in cell wall biosynthesis